MCGIELHEAQYVKRLAKLNGRRESLIRHFTVQEGGRTPPPYPSVFIKPSTSLAGFEDDILIPKIAQVTLDYEGELVS